MSADGQKAWTVGPSNSVIARSVDAGVTWEAAVRPPGKGDPPLGRLRG